MGEIKSRANVPRLIQILAAQYEENPRVVLRELIQNAADAITEAKKVGAETHAGIDVEIFGENDRSQFDVHVGIRDSALGMDEAEFGGYLATLGAGSKIEDIDSIGEWGIGFYSIVVICKSAIVATKTAGGDIIAYRYSVLDDTFSELPAHELAWLSNREFHPNKRTSGTSILLEIAFDKWPALKDWLNRQRLEIELRTFCLFIPYPIRVSTEDSLAGEVVNLFEPPWGKPSAGKQAALNGLWEKTLPYTTVDNYPRLAHCFDDSLDAHATLSGVCYFIPGYRGAVQIYYKHMFVEGAHDVLPHWCRHISIISNIRTDRESKYHLSVPPARTHVVRNDAFFEVIPHYERQAGEALTSWFEEYQNELQAALATCDQETRARAFSEISNSSVFPQVLEGVAEVLRNICLDLSEILATACSAPTCSRTILHAVRESLFSERLELASVVPALQEQARHAKDRAEKERESQRHTGDGPTWYPLEHRNFVSTFGDLVLVTIMVKEFPHGSRPHFSTLRVPVRCLPLIDPSLMEAGVVRIPTLGTGEGTEYLYEADDRLVVVPRPEELLFLAALDELRDDYNLAVVSVEDKAFSPATYADEWEDLKRTFEQLVTEKGQGLGGQAMYKVQVSGYTTREFPIIIHEENDEQILTINTWNRGMKSLNEAVRRTLASGSMHTEKAIRSLVHDLYHSASYPRETALTEATLHVAEVKDQMILDVCETLSQMIDAKVGGEK